MRPNKISVLNDEVCMVTPTLTDMNPSKLKYYPFVISLNECAGSCNVLSPKIFFPKETTKVIYVKAFNIITNKKEAKAMTKNISCDCKCKFNSVTCNEIVIVMDILSTKNPNTIATNVTSTVSINCHTKKVRDCYILHTVLLVII